MGVDPPLLRSVMGRLATGVTVVTSMLDGQPIAMTANAVTSVSLQPPLLLVCAERTSLTLKGTKQCGFFAVNVLRAGQEDLARRFAAPGLKSFDGVAYRTGEHGAPLLEECLAWLECTLDTIHDGGDHEIMIGRTAAATAGSDAAPLLFFRGAYA